MHGEEHDARHTVENWKQRRNMIQQEKQMHILIYLVQHLCKNYSPEYTQGVGSPIFCNLGGGFFSFFFFFLFFFNFCREIDVPRGGSAKHRHLCSAWTRNIKRIFLTPLLETLPSIENKTRAMLLRIFYGSSLEFLECLKTKMLFCGKNAKKGGP